MGVATTITYAELLNRAGEMVGVPRAVQSADDALLLKSFAAIHLREAWHAARWPVLRHSLEYTVSSYLVSKTAGAYEIGEVIKVTSEDWRTARYKKIGWLDEGANLRILDNRETVWVDFMQACPDLATESVATVPIRLANPILYKTAGSYWRSKGKTDQGNEFLTLGEAALATEAQLVQRASINTE